MPLSFFGALLWVIADVLQENSETQPPLSALQRLSLERKARGAHPEPASGNHSHSLLRGRGRGGGRGRGRCMTSGSEVTLRSEAEEARAPMAIDDEIDSARGAKRPQMSQANGEVTGSRPSKLAALAAARSAHRSSPSPAPRLHRDNAKALLAEPTEQSWDENAVSSSKPLSKLQQRMQAQMAARQQRKSGLPAKEDDARAAAEALAENERSRLSLLVPSGKPISDLFPTDSAYGLDSWSGNCFRSMLGSLAGTFPENDGAVKDIPGGSLFAAGCYEDAFAGPSPDDAVLRARKGTSLGK